MDLTEDQKKQIAARLAEGAGISDIQRLINDDFKIHMTYMDVRFLMDDLDLDLAPEPEPEPEPEEEKEVSAEAELVDDGHPPPGGAVSVEIDTIKRPGAAVSGSVVFSDGAKAAWYVDQMGRLGLDPQQEGYQPSPEDIQEFQMELQRQIQGPGA